MTLSRPLGDAKATLERGENRLKLAQKCKK